MNPFRGSNHYIDSAELLIGRDSELKEVRQHIEVRKDRLLIGLKGIGKTSLLHCAVDTAFRRKMIETKKILVTRPFEYPATLATEKVYPFLMDQIIKTFSLLDDETDNEFMNIIGKHRKRYATPAEQFKCSITDFHDLYGFSVTLVIDNFEHFANSTSVTAEQHNELRGLMDEKDLRFIVVTNYDLTHDALPPHSQYSYLLQKFSGNFLPVAPVLMTDVKSMLEREPWPDQVDNKALRILAGKIHELSGGIPLMARHVAAEAYDHLQEKDFALWTSEDWNVISNKAYQNNQSLLNSWCGMLCTTWVDALKQVHTRSGVPKDTGIAMNLFYRRLLKQGTAGGGSYSYVSPLLERFVAEDNVKPDDSLLPAGTLAMAQVDMNRLMSMVQLLVDRSKTQAIDDNKPLASQVDAAPVNSDQQVTLDIAFNNYRAEHPNDLPDSLLADLGEACLQDLKQALVFKAYVDYGITSLGDTTRTALYYYALTLERHLQNNFLELFTADPQLVPSSLDRDPTIGAFQYVIGNSPNRMANLCKRCKLPQSEPAWWFNLSDALRSAKDLRNYTDHTGVQNKRIANMTPIELMNEMHRLLVGENALLAGITVGKRLLNKIRAGELGSIAQEQVVMKGKTYTFRCTRVKQRGALSGILLPSCLGGTISANKVSAAQKALLLPSRDGASPEESAGLAVGREFSVVVDGVSTETDVLTVHPVPPASN